MEKYTDEYCQQCCDKTIEEIEKMTWKACTGDVIIGHLLFKIEELEKELKKNK